MAIPPQLVDFKMTFVRLYLIPADFSFLQSIMCDKFVKVRIYKRNKTKKGKTKS